MPNWKKLITSGSAASLSSLTLDTALPVSQGGTGATTLTSNGILTGNGTSAIQAESNLTFDAATGNFSSGDGSESVTHEPSSNYLTVHETGASKGSHLRLATDNSDFILTAGGGTNQLSLYDVNGVANRLIVTSAGTFQFQQDVSVPATKKVYLDGGSDSYIYQSASDIVNIYTGGENTLELSAGGADPRISYFNKDNRDRDFSFCGNTTDNVLYFDASTERIGIGTNSPASKLHVVGDVNATGDVVAYYSSDKRLKDNIVRIENPLEKVGKIGGYTFDWNDKQETYTGKDVGVIAQEIQEVLPELVTERDNGYLAVKYEKIVPLLIESIKELKQEIDDIKQKCDCLNK